MNVTVALSPIEWQLAFRLTDELCELNGAEQNARLNSLGQQFPRLRPVLIDLIAGKMRGEADEFLKDLPPLAITGDKDNVKTGTAFATGQAIGPWRLIREIGAGGMGSVWLAERADGIVKRHVALKLPRDCAAKHQLAERFLRERDIHATLTHPNIARLYDAGAAENGQPYLAMEYIEGTTLTEYCDHKRLGVAERLSLFRQVLSAVQYAHANLVLHRDLKPSNILVSAEGRVSLLDFGIAKFMRGAETAATELTQLGGAALTPDYASPEQITGAPLSTASDVYSLGIVLYELLAGARPYKLKRGTRGELEEAILAADPPRLYDSITHASRDSVAAKRGLSPAKLQTVLRGELDTLIRKAIKKAPALRYTTADAFLADINRYLANEPIAAQPDSLLYTARKFVARNRLMAISAGVVFTSMLAGIVATSWQAREAAMQRDEARTEAKNSQAYRNFMRLMLTTTGNGGRALTTTELLNEARQKIEKNYVNMPGEGADVMQQIAQNLVELDEMQLGREVAARAYELAKQSGNARQIAQSLCVLGEAELKRGNSGDAMSRLREAMPLLANAKRLPLETRARCMRLESSLALKNADVATAIASSEAALALIEREDPEDLGNVLISALSHLGHVYMVTGRPRDAYGAETRLMNFLNARGLENIAAATGTRNNRAMALLAMGEFVSAESAYAEALQRYGSSTPSGSAKTGQPVPPWLLGNYGEVMRRLGRLSEAAQLQQRAADAAKAAGASQSIILIRQSLIASKLGDIAAAETFFAHAREEVGKSEPADKMTLLKTWLIAAEATLARERDNSAGARATLDRTLAAMGFPAQQNRPGMRHLLQIAAEIAITQGDFAAARSYVPALLAITRHTAREASSSADVGEAELLNARLLMAEGNRSAAREALATAKKAIEHGLGPNHVRTAETQKLMAAMDAETRS